MSRVIAQEDALLQVYAFLESCGYTKTMVALQSESGIPYNVIHSVSQAPTSRRKEEAPRTAQALEAAVLEGNWFEVLSRYVDGLLLPQDVKETLYETIFEELLELHGLREAARALLSHSPVFKEMKVRSPARFARLENILQHFNAAAVEERSSARATTTPAEVQTKRETVLRHLLAHIHFSSEPYDGFLPAALAARRAAVMTTSPALNPVDAEPPHAVQQRGKRPRADDDGDDVHTGDSPAGPVSLPRMVDPLHHVKHPADAPMHIDKKVTFSDDTLVACCASLPAPTTAAADGHALALLGRANGVLDFVDAATGAACGASVAHTAGVLSLATDCPPGEPAWVAVGYRDGTVKVYNAASRKLVRRFPTVHTLGVTCLAFLGTTCEEGLTGHHALLVTGSFDTTIHVLGLAQGSSLFHLRGCHNDAFVNAVCPLHTVATDSGSGVFLSAGNDGMLCAWKVRRGFPAGTATRCTRLVNGTTPLRALYKPTGDAIPTALLQVPRTTSDAGQQASELTATNEVVVLTRSNVALILSVNCVDASQASSAVAADYTELSVSYTVLCAVDTQHALRFGACLVSASTLALPILSLYVTDENGTILLFNTEMTWRNAERWAQHAGVRHLTQSTGQSAVVVVDAGESIHDLHLACFARTAACPKVRVVACSPSLHSAYLLQ